VAQLRKGEINKEVATVNQMDEMITKAMLRLETKKCKKKDHALWTPSLTQSNL
jgi:hypothetical protein